MGGGGGDDQTKRESCSSGGRRKTNLREGTFFGRKQRNERRRLEGEKRIERPFWSEKRA